MPTYFKCDCGKLISHNSYWKHIKSKKHILILEIIDGLTNDELNKLLKKFDKKINI